MILHPDCVRTPIIGELLDHGAHITDIDGWAIAHPNSAELMSVVLCSTTFDRMGKTPRKIAEFETELSSNPNDEASFALRAAAEALWRIARAPCTTLALAEAADAKWPERGAEREQEARLDRAYGQWQSGGIR